jgi:hypothetical protein
MQDKIRATGAAENTPSSNLTRDVFTDKERLLTFKENIEPPFSAVGNQINLQAKMEIQFQGYDERRRSK